MLATKLKLFICKVWRLADHGVTGANLANLTPTFNYTHCANFDDKRSFPNETFCSTTNLSEQLSEGATVVYSVENVSSIISPKLQISLPLCTGCVVIFLSVFIYFAAKRLYEIRVKRVKSLNYVPN